MAERLTERRESPERAGMRGSSSRVRGSLRADRREEYARMYVWMIKAPTRATCRSRPRRRGMDRLYIYRNIPAWDCMRVPRLTDEERRRSKILFMGS